MMKTMKALFGPSFCLSCAVLTFAPNTALAHGEKALEPSFECARFNGMSYWSKDTLTSMTSGDHRQVPCRRGLAARRAQTDATYLNGRHRTCVCPHRAVSERAGFGQLRSLKLGVITTSRSS